MYRDHRKGPGGPPDGATYPGGPHGLKWRGNQPLMGWCVPPKGPRRLGLETLGGRCPPRGHAPPWLETLRGSLPPGAAPPLYGISKGACAPLAPIYSGREGRQTHLALGASLSLRNTSPPRLCLAKPCRDPAASTTTPSCCWIFINLSFPLAGSRRRRRLPNRTCVERGGVVRSALGHR